MNWSAWVWGTNATDYLNCTEFCPSIPNGVSVLRQVMEAACGDEAEFSAKLESLDTIFHSPPFDTPLNIARRSLAFNLHENWTKYWFEEASLEGRQAGLQKRGLKLNKRNSGLQIGGASPNESVGCNTVPTALSMNWTYDATIRLQGVGQAKRPLPTGLQEEARKRIDADWFQSLPEDLQDHLRFWSGMDTLK
mmetsp:Transcript_42778/g.96378  ORF Transcript_42778/g.96378 Transcript_42778/m.96378 type:complete len:193 (+) Transcript_42778:752-1330(+)